MSNVRLRRLQADHDNLVQYVKQHPRLRLIQAEGDPPERYQIEYRIKSLRQIDDDLKEIKSHLVEISLPRNYPRTPPLCRMLTPVFHPNIAPHAICVGDHWSAGEPLKSIVARIGEMLAYQSYNVKSPLNGEAARWVEQNLDQLPLDKVSLLVEETASDDNEEAESPESTRRAAAGNPRIPKNDQKMEASKSSAVPRKRMVTSDDSEETESPETTRQADGSPRIPNSDPKTAEPVKIRVGCPNCDKQFQVLPENMGRKARCSKCQRVFTISDENLVQ